MKYLSLEDILVIHSYVVDEFGGSHGIRDLGRVESAVATQMQEVFGAEPYPSIFLKSAAIMRGLIQDHAFVDGNKRTAVVAVVSFLRWNNCPFQSLPGEIENLAVSVAIDKLEVDEIAHWLELHCSPTI